MKHSWAVVSILALTVGGLIDRRDTPTAHAATTVQPTDRFQPQVQDDKAAQRKSCQFAKGATTLSTLGAGLPKAEDIPIDRIVVLMLENRSFDHYLSGLTGSKYYGSAADQAKGQYVDAANLSASAGQSDGKRGTVRPYHEKRYCMVDTGRTWTKFTRIQQWRDEQVCRRRATTRGPGTSVGYYTDEDVPYYYRPQTRLRSRSALLDTSGSDLAKPFLLLGQRRGAHRDERRRV